ncbi:MAG: preprotein translocase subunit SecE [Acidimicrobiia bacterium]
MSMNRETKRLLQRQGAINEAGAPVRQPRTPGGPGGGRPPGEERTSPREFIRQVVAELRKVAWPTKSEVINYSIVVLVAVVLMTALIAGLDYVIGSGVLKLFDV